MDTISIVRHGLEWAVKHRGSFIGHARNVEEAAAVGRRLVAWLQDEGRPARLILPGACVETASAAGTAALSRRLAAS